MCEFFPYIRKTSCEELICYFIKRRKYVRNNDTHNDVFSIFLSGGGGGVKYFSLTSKKKKGHQNFFWVNGRMMRSGEGRGLNPEPSVYIRHWVLPNYEMLVKKNVKFQSTWIPNFLLNRICIAKRIHEQINECLAC